MTTCEIWSGCKSWWWRNEAHFDIPYSCHHSLVVMTLEIPWSKNLTARVIRKKYICHQTTCHFFLKVEMIEKKIWALKQHTMYFTALDTTKYIKLYLSPFWNNSTISILHSILKSKQMQIHIFVLPLHFQMLLLNC